MKREDSTNDKPRVMIGTHDVTEHVAAMYDAIVASADWGSDFLDWETIFSILVVGKLAGFELILPSPPEDRVPRPRWAGSPMNGPEWTGYLLELENYKTRVATWHAQVKAALDAKAEEPINQETCENVAVELLSHVESIRK